MVDTVSIINTILFTSSTFSVLLFAILTYVDSSFENKRLKYLIAGSFFMAIITNIIGIFCLRNHEIDIDYLLSSYVLSNFLLLLSGMYFSIAKIGKVLK